VRLTDHMWTVLEAAEHRRVRRTARSYRTLNGGWTTDQHVRVSGSVTALIRRDLLKVVQGAGDVEYAVPTPAGAAHLANRGVSW